MQTHNIQRIISEIPGDIRGNKTPVADTGKRGKMKKQHNTKQSKAKRSVILHS
jgi:hypothetical protein